MQIRRQALLLVILTILQMLIAVVITEWSAALFNDLEQHSMQGLVREMALLALIFATNMAVTVKHLRIKRALQIGWRDWLTRHVASMWMRHGRHYQVRHVTTAEHDNPDGRIAEDVRIATEDAITLCHSLFYCLLLLISFASILWGLSGTLTVALGPLSFAVHGYLFWAALLYAASASVLGWKLGRPLTVATHVRQTMEANFRFDLVTARENSEAIALIKGDAKQRQHFWDSFANIVSAYDRQTHAMSVITLFTSGYSVLSMAFPVLMSAPRYILGSITLGSLMQSVQAFQQTTAALSWPVDNMGAVAQWRASVERVLSLVKALEDLELELDSKDDPYRIVLDKGEQPILSFHHLCIGKRDQLTCLPEFDEFIRAGEHLLITGDTATGEKLFKAIAGLWPWGRGRIGLPDDEPMFFMPPQPYLPRGPLRAAICYPHASDCAAPGELEQVLHWVGAEDMIGQLEQSDAWDSVLPRADKQRLGVARLLLRKPKWILLTEAFDSLPPTVETDMYRLISQKLPDATLLTLSNQPAAEPFHSRRIHLPD